MSKRKRHARLQDCAARDCKPQHANLDGIVGVCDLSFAHLANACLAAAYSLCHCFKYRSQAARLYNEKHSAACENAMHDPDVPLSITSLQHWLVY